MSRNFDHAEERDLASRGPVAPDFSSGDPAGGALAPGELDLRGIGDAVKRRRRMILIATAAGFVLSFAAVNLISPRYQGETMILLENQENVFTLPEKPGQAPGQVLPADAEAVGSQVQLITSRDLAARAIKELGLRDNPEFEPSSAGLFSALMGTAAPAGESAETRAIKTFEDKLSVFSPPKTRVITIQFQSKSPVLAAQVANKLADLYVAEQSGAKQNSAKRAADALSAQIADLRVKLANADAAREKYRSDNGLLTTGLNNLTIDSQQLADINTELSKARTQQADAQAKATLIRELVRSGKTADMTEIINNDLVRRVADQRLAAQANLALESQTLLPSHPRIQALRAQLAELDGAMKSAASQAIGTLENEAKIAGQRLHNLETVLAERRKAAGVSNGDEVSLRSLDRVAQSYKDQLESSMAKYQEAVARETSNATPADARIIARAIVPQEPVFPKKVPIVAFVTVAALVLSCGFAVARDLLDVPQSPMPQPSSPRRGPEPMASAPLRRRNGPAIKPVSTLFAQAGRGLRAFGESAYETRMRTGAGEEASEAPAPFEDRGEQPSAYPLEAAGEDRDHYEFAGRRLAERIVAARAPGRALQIAGAAAGPDPDCADKMIGLARILAERGRTIIADLNATPEGLEPLVNPRRGVTIFDLGGLAELLAGEISFAEAIHRDQGSRLHFLPAGRHEADFRDFDLVLEALAETYDYVIMFAPAFPGSEIVKIVAPHTDFIVLSAAGDIAPRQLTLLKDELTEAGAREILVAGQSPQAARRGRRPGVA